MYRLKRNNVVKETDNKQRRDALLDQGYTELPSETEDKKSRGKTEQPKEGEKE